MDTVGELLICKGMVGVLLQQRNYAMPPSKGVAYDA